MAEPEELVIVGALFLADSTKERMGVFAILGKV
jgi:hypothetical protein